MTRAKRTIIATVIANLTCRIRMLPVGSPEREELKHERRILESMLWGAADE